MKTKQTRSATLAPLALAVCDQAFEVSFAKGLFHFGVSVNPSFADGALRVSHHLLQPGHLDALQLFFAEELGGSPRSELLC